MNKIKEIAKFAAGLTAWESVVHASLWLSDSEPVIFGIKIATTVNVIQTIIPGIMGIVLTRYAWMKK